MRQKSSLCGKGLTAVQKYCKGVEDAVNTWKVCYEYHVSVMVFIQDGFLNLCKFYSPVRQIYQQG